MIKKALIAALFAVGNLSPMVAMASAPNETGLDLAVGLSQSEGGSGYFTSLSWQFSDYAELAVSGRSQLDGDTYELSDVVTAERLQQIEDIAGGAGKYTPTSFSPRHNTVGLSVTLRYPIDLSGWSVAPFVDVGTQQNRTKDLDIYAASSSGGTGTGTGTGTGSGVDNNKKIATVSFDSSNALMLGAGLQFVVEEHYFRIGYHSYSTNEPWSELQVKEDIAGAWLQYDYFFNDNWAFKFMFDSADQFDQPLFDVGIRYSF